MQKIEKEITVTVYVAFDGTEFVTDTECQRYEGSAFGQLMQELQGCILSHYIDHNGSHHYTLVPHTRHDIYLIGQILQMAGEDTQCSECCDHLTQLDVTLNCNVVEGVHITNLEDYILERSNGQYAVVSTIKSAAKEPEK